MLPGRMLHRVAYCICGTKTLERVVEPAIADLQNEYAVAATPPLRRAATLLTGYVGILKVIAICALSVSAAIEDERRTLVRTVAWSATMVAVILAIFLAPLLYSRPTMGWRLATAFVPQALALAIPLGIAFGIALGLRARPTMNIAKMLLLCALAASALNFGNLAWAMPAGNHAFREMTFRELRATGDEGPVTGLQKGYNEMSFSELQSESARFLAEGEPRRARQFTFRLHLRFALAAAAFALASVLLAAAARHRGWHSLIALGLCVVYWMLMVAGDVGSRRGYLPPPIGAWLPNLVMIGSAIVVASSRLRGSRTTAR